MKFRTIVAWLVLLGTPAFAQEGVIAKQVGGLDISRQTLRAPKLAQLTATGIGSGGFGASSGPGYTAQGIHFNGATQLFNPSALNAPLTGSTNTKVGTISFWLKTAVGTDGTSMGVLQAFPQYSCFFDRIPNANAIQLTCQNSSGTNILLQRSGAAVVAASGWTSVVSSWDLSVPVFQLYINGSLDTPLSLALTNDTIAYASPNNGSIVGSDGNFNYMTGDMADIYFDQAHRLDLSVSANLQKFISGGNAVDLGTNCTNPTGSQPIICMKGAVATWQNNANGFAGAYTINSGSLSAAATNPP